MQPGPAHQYNLARAVTEPAIKVHALSFSGDVSSNLEQYGRYLRLQFGIQQTIASCPLGGDLSRILSGAALAKQSLLWDDLIDVLGVMPHSSGSLLPCADILSVIGLTYASEAMDFFATQALEKNNPLRLSNIWGARHLWPALAEARPAFPETTKSIRALNLSAEGQLFLQRSMTASVDAVRALWNAQLRAG